MTFELMASGCQWTCPRAKTALLPIGRREVKMSSRDVLRSLLVPTAPTFVTTDLSASTCGVIRNAGIDSRKSHPVFRSELCRLYLSV